MKKKLLVALLACLFVLPQFAFAWDRKEHDAIACIAEHHLTDKAKANIKKYLKGHSIIFYASWMDDFRFTDPWKETDKWHMSYADENMQYVEKEDALGVSALERSIEALKDGKYKSLSDEEVAQHIKYITHIVGDMHCPGHIFYPEIEEQWFIIQLHGGYYTYHSVWDGRVTGFSNTWSYSEYQQQLDIYSEEEIKEIAKGTPREWFHETAVYCHQIYDMAKPGYRRYGLDFVNNALPIAYHQITYAGYRLAKVLNDIFG